MAEQLSEQIKAVITMLPSIIIIGFICYFIAAMIYTMIKISSKMWKTL